MRKSFIPKSPTNDTLMCTIQTNFGITYDALDIDNGDDLVTKSVGNNSPTDDFDINAYLE